ncbi:hypothetical protein [Flavobacterium notoginsengisoli]|uniref:hypothetical protein n=1 Tax=Flavobacterium notoginsengisoli TaxID=1478199 RepID=UPI003632C8D7
MDTQINEMIYALEKLNPAKLNQIRTRYSDHSEILESGVVLGEEVNKNPDAEILIKAEICKESNNEILKKCDVEFPIIKRRIKNYRKLNLLSQIITALSSAGVVSTLLADNIKNQKSIGLIMGFIGLVSSLIPIINEHIITGINNKKINESFEDIVKYRLEIESNNKELFYFITAKIPDYEKISAIINNCNEKTSLIMQILILA